MAIKEKNYETVIDALVEKINSQDTTILLQKCRIEKLEKALEDAEAQKCKETIKPVEKLEIR